MTKKFDAIIVGTGQAGPSLAQRMTGEGLKVAILERKLFGGTCVNVRCIPTKTLVASARAAYMARRGGSGPGQYQWILILHGRLRQRNLRRR